MALVDVTILQTRSYGLSEWHSYSSPFAALYSSPFPARLLVVVHNCMISVIG